MNLFVVTGLIPSPAPSLPFFSYGGTALMLQLAENGHPAQMSAVYAHRAANRIAKSSYRPPRRRERYPFRRAEGCEGEDRNALSAVQSIPHIQFIFRINFACRAGERGKIYDETLYYRRRNGRSCHARSRYCTIFEKRQPETVIRFAAPARGSRTSSFRARLSGSTPSRSSACRAR